MKYFDLAISDEFFEKLTDLRLKWNKDKNTSFTWTDVIRISVNTIWENEINSLNKTLTKSSEA